MSDCELCNLNHETHRYNCVHQKFVVIECQTCRTPMVIFREHTMEISEQDAREMLGMIAGRANGIYGEGNYWIDKNQRQVKGHLHFHARRKGE